MAENHNPFLLSVLFARETGLPVTVWAATRGGMDAAAYILISPGAGDFADVSSAVKVDLKNPSSAADVALDPGVWNPVESWVDLNFEALMGHSEGLIRSGDLVRGLRRIHPIPSAHPRERGDPVLS